MWNKPIEFSRQVWSERNNKSSLPARTPQDPASVPTSSTALKSLPERASADHPSKSAMRKGAHALSRLLKYRRTEPLLCCESSNP